MKSTIRGIMAAFALLFSGQVMAGDLAAELGYEEVAPNFFITAVQKQELKDTGCTGGPDGLFNEYRKDLAEEGAVWCSRQANSDLGKYLKSGAMAWRIMMTPLGAQMEVYLKGKGRDPNLRCTGTLPMRGVTDVNMTCVNTANGQMMFDSVLGNLIGNGGAMAIGSIAANLTAPKAGDSTINVGSQSGSVATSGSESNSTGSGAAGPITFNVTATGGQGGNAGATSNSSVVGPAPCGTSVCH